MLKENLSVIFPMYNEEEIIERAVLSAIKAVDDIVEDLEIIIVNDGSLDNSRAIVEELCRNDKRVSLINHECNMGLDCALKTGFMNASKDLILYTDSDMPFDMREVKKALYILTKYNADIISVFRMTHHGDGILKMICSVVYNLLIRALFIINIQDVNFSFKLFRKKVLDKIDLESKGSIIDTEFIVKSFRRGFKIVQFGTDYFPRKTGKSNFLNLE